MKELNLSRLPGEAESRQKDAIPELGRPDDVGEIIGSEPHVPPAALAFTLDDVLQVLQRQRRTLLAGAIAGVLITLLVLALTTSLYAVSARVVITQQSAGKLVDTDSGSSTFIATQAEVIHSPTVVQAAVAALPTPDHLSPEDDAVADALNSVHASAVSGTRVIALGYLGGDANYGAALLTAMVDAYVTDLRDTTRLSQAQSLDTKTAELDVLLEEIGKQESKIGELRQISAIVGTADEAATTQIERLSDQVTELMKVRNRRIELESRLATGGARLNSDDPVRNSLLEEMRQAESKLARAKLSLTTAHPTVVAAERNVEVLRVQLDASFNASPRKLWQQIREASRQEAQLAALEAQSRERLEVIEVRRRDENELIEELARTRSLADEWRRELFDQRLVARLAQSGDVGIGARFIAEPAVPDGAVWPKPALMLPAGAVFGLVGGFLFALVSLQRQRRHGVTNG